MRILITTSIRFALNGVTNVILNYYRNIISEDITFDFVVVNNVDKEIKEEIINRGGTVYELPMRNHKPIKYIRELTKICNKGKYDIIHSHGNSYTLALEMYAAKRAKVKVRISHSHATSCKNKVVNLLLKPLFISSYTHGFACSDLAGKWLFDQRKYYIINNAFVVGEFCYNQNVRIKYRDELDLGNQTVIGHVGGFNDAKNHHFLIDIFNEYQEVNPNSKLILIGDGKNKKEIEQYVEGLNLKNHVLFFGSRDDVESILNVFDVFVFPSINEGLGIVLLEAQANGLPVFASDAIPEKSKVLNSFQFISLNDGPEKWAELICKSEKSRNAGGHKVIVDSGYDIRYEAKKLERLYYKLLYKDK